MLSTNYLDNKEFYDDVQKSKYIVFLSSVQFATTVLDIFNTSVLSQNTNQTYSFLFGDFWGDPRDADTLFELIVDLVNRGHKVYALRNDINGTEMLQEHMASIRYNSTEWRRNKWLQEYWKKYFNCTDTSPCDGSQSLPPIYRPILRNYKAPLVMDGVFLVRKFVEDYNKTNGFMPDELYIEELYKLASSNNVTLRSDWTNNSFIYGQAGDYNKSFLWNQPIEWQFRIIELYSLNYTLHNWEYGIWTIGKHGLDNSDGSLILFDYNQTIPSSPVSTVAPNSSNMTTFASGDLDYSDNNATNSNDSELKMYTVSVLNDSSVIPKVKLQDPVFDVCVTEPPPTETPKVDDPCDPDKLHGMVGLVVVTIVLLIVVSLIYICHDSGGISGVKHLMKSPGKDILMSITVFSIIISFWIIFGDEALDCDSRADDFLVSLANGISFSVLLVYVACRRFENRLWKLCLKVFGFLSLVIVQLVLSSVAHLDHVETDSNNGTVQRCFDERSKSVAAGSYWFGGIVLLGCIALLFIDVCCKRDEDDRRIRFVDIIKACLAVAVGIIYIVALVFISSANKSKCIEHGQFFILLALFPAIMSLLVAAVPTFTEVYEQRRHQKEMAALDLECKFLSTLHSTFHLSCYVGIQPAYTVRPVVGTMRHFGSL